MTEAHTSLQKKRIKNGKILLEFNGNLEGQMKLNTVQGKNKCQSRYCTYTGTQSF
jgi:hypothetical protein